MSDPELLKSSPKRSYPDTSRLRRSQREELFVWLGWPGGPAEPHKQLKNRRAAGGEASGLERQEGHKPLSEKFGMSHNNFTNASAAGARSEENA